MRLTTILLVQTYSFFFDIDFKLLEQSLLQQSISGVRFGKSKTVASIILGGGEGTRLFPLTGRRAKPTVS